VRLKAENGDVKEKLKKEVERGTFYREEMEVSEAGRTSGCEPNG
jgi:hypothetical protein